MAELLPTLHVAGPCSSVVIPFVFFWRKRMIRAHGFRLAFTLTAILCALPSFAQYTDSAAVNELGGPQEFARRRTDLAKQLKTGYLILFARKVLPEAVHYREDNDFFYFTGISDPGAVLVMDIAKGNTLLFEPEQSPRTKQVYGPNVLSLS